MTPDAVPISDDTAGLDFTSCGFPSSRIGYHSYPSGLLPPGRASRILTQRIPFTMEFDTTDLSRNYSSRKRAPKA